MLQSQRERDRGRGRERGKDSFRESFREGGCSPSKKSQLYNRAVSQYERVNRQRKRMFV
jgi:hypothetical protein